jgi:ATP-dependent Clp protease ATP-binding subunit ClpC
MSDRLSKEVRTILGQAEVLARASGKQPTTVHHLMAMYVVECHARDLLVETGIDDARVLDTFERMSERYDTVDAVTDVLKTAGDLADRSGAAEVTSTVLLAALLRHRQVLACRVLERAGVELSGLRARVIGQVTLSSDRASSSSQLRAVGRSAVADDTRVRERPATATTLERLEPRSPMALHPVLEARNQEARPEPEPVRPPDPPPAERVTVDLRPPVAPRGVDQDLCASHGVFDLDRERFPTLHGLGRNLTLCALRGELDPLIGRDALVDAVIDVLLMKQVNNPCLIGEAGVGKTAIVEGLAQRLAGKTREYGKLGSAVVVEIQVGSLLAGTSLRGAFSERMRKLRDEVARAAGQVLVFMDELHTIMGAGTGDGPLDAANDLKSDLSRGRFPLIGATTRTEYERHIEKDPAMVRRFQVIEVPEPSAQEAIAILAGVAPVYAKHHGIRYAHDAVVSAVHLSQRFVNERCLPAKAIDVLDRAGAQARRGGKAAVSADDVARAVHFLTSVPMDRLLADERGRIRDLASDLQRKIVGHDGAMQRIARRVQRNYAGFSGDRPLASFLFAGAPGVGKTETARALAEALFVSGDALVRFDMTEYAESHSVARLIGSPPGYVGHGTPGLLAQALQRRPYRVLLFDEVDRAAPEVIGLLNQLLDAGKVSDHHGQTVDVRNSILVLTTNVGSELLNASNSRRSIGFGVIEAPLAPAAANADPADQPLVDRVRKVLPADLVGRIDDAVVFRPLAVDAAREVVRRCLNASADRLFASRLIRYAADESVVDLVLQGGVDSATGVRPLRARIESLVEAFVTECILDGRLQPGSEVQLSVADGRLALQPVTVTAQVTVAH